MGSWIDVVLVFALVTSIAIGYNHGLLRQALLLIAIYLGTVAAGQFYEGFAVVLMRSFPAASLDVANMVAFLMLLAAFTGALAWLSISGFRNTRLPRLTVLDNLCGALLGAVFGLFAISLGLMMASYSIQTPWPDGSAMYYALSTGLRSSELSEVFSVPVPVLQSALKPLLPGNLPFVS